MDRFYELPAPFSISSRSYMAGTLLACMWLVGALAPAMGAEAQPGRVKIEYVAPKDPKHQALYDLLRQRQALENLQRLFSPFRLPADLTIKIEGCDGIANAWYERGSVTLCYELLTIIRQPMPKDVTWAGTTHDDAVVGQFLYIAGHEVGHAMFDMLKVPIFGNEEDAADQFSTYLMLRLGSEQARRLIFGAAYYFRRYLQNPTVTTQLKTFSDAHSRPPERFFNLLCMAYGANRTMFADLVDKQYLPKDRAMGCPHEYRKLTFAFQTLILPHIDQDAAQTVLDEAWLILAPR
jgi:hypothetical protein